MKRILFLLFTYITYITYPTFAGVYSSEIIGACGGSDNLYATFTPNQYTCNSGYFLPANSSACTICPSGFSCVGGTYTFNETRSNGLVQSANINQNINNACASNFINRLVAKFEPNQYTCNPGYYLPANAIACVICPVDSYCGGGTYTFNETVPQGIVSCGAGLYSPVGMSSSNQCGRILHIEDNVVYLHSVKKTTPALHVDIDQDGTADFFGNMTTLDVPMTHGTDKKLKLQYDGVTYSVYDDSVDLSEYTN